MPYTARKAEAVMDLRHETVCALLLHVTRDWTLEQLEGLIEQRVWHAERDALSADYPTDYPGED